MGDGRQLFGGNVHAVCTDELGLPYVPDTQIRGLVKLAARRMANSYTGFATLYHTNFNEQDHKRGKWSFTAARYPRTVLTSL